MDDIYYITVGSEKKGPYALSQIQSMWRAGAITADARYWQEGFADWVAITQLKDLLDQKPPQFSPPTSQEVPPALTANESDKRILPAFLLCFFLGIFGVHAFYAGRSGQGLLYVGFIVLFLLTFASIGPLFLLFAAVFSLGDLIRIIVGAYKDAQDRKITKWS